MVALAWLAREQVGVLAGGGRRGVLIAAGVLGAAAVLGGVGGQLVSRLRLRPEDVTLPDPTDPARPLPPGLDKQVTGITPFQTDNDDFYRVDTRLDTPVVTTDDWTLTIDGDVDNKVTLTFAELLDLPMIERDITLTCVSNSVGGEYVGSARWLGVRLTDVLDLAGVGSKADQILSTDFDGMTISTPLDLATDGRDAMLCVGMNGEPLPREHGFPVRMLIPGLYGFISATKWLTKLTLTTYDDQEAYWTQRGWATDAPIKISARIDTPRALADLMPARLSSAGSPGPSSEAGSRRCRSASTAERGPTRTSARTAATTTGASGSTAGTRPVGRTGLPPGRFPALARNRPRPAPSRSPRAPAVSTKSSSTSAEQPAGPVGPVQPVQPVQSDPPVAPNYSRHQTPHGRHDP